MCSKKLSKITAFILIILIMMPTGILLADVPRFGGNDQNTHCISDPKGNNGPPFALLWQKSIGADVASQPICVNGYIYVQAGKYLYKLDVNTGDIVAKSDKLTDSELPSGSAPTYASTVYGDRIYQATRDHRLWALDPDTLKPLWTSVGYFTLSAGNHPEKRYRVTSSPLVVNMDGNTYIAIGTSNGDQTGLSNQYADNGFFILKDCKNEAKAVYTRQMSGELSGSPAIIGNVVIGTQNNLYNQYQEDLIVAYDLKNQFEIPQDETIPKQIPGSTCISTNIIYLADRSGCLYGYTMDENNKMKLKFKNNSCEGGYNLNSPVVGKNNVYLAVRKEKNSNGGKLLAANKYYGTTIATKSFLDILASNPFLWEPSDSDESFLLQYSGTGAFNLVDGNNLNDLEGFIDENNKLTSKVSLSASISGLKEPEPIISDGYIIMADPKGNVSVWKKGEIKYITPTDLSAEIVPVNCDEKHDRDSFDVTYKVLVGYEEYTTSTKDPVTGKITYTSHTDYSSPIYSPVTVTYNEYITTKAAVATGQGTLKEAGAADMEGRGAWEIISYAKKKAKDPETITRAGAGFTITVNTSFSTEWESKVPANATAYGGTYPGVTYVSAEIYDKKGKLIDNISLEETSSGVWELPKVSHKYLDGSTSSVRKYFTDVNTPDGNIRVLVKCGGAGKTGLYSCEVVNVEIYGSVYDDIYTKLK